MAKVNWINGSIEPPETGRYYVIAEALVDHHGLKKGNIVIDVDQWFHVLNKWSCYNIDFNILSWAPMLYPDIPADLQGRVKRYFGQEVKNDGTVSK